MSQAETWVGIENDIQFFWSDNKRDLASFPKFLLMKNSLNFSPQQKEYLCVECGTEKFFLWMSGTNILSSNRMQKCDFDLFSLLLSELSTVPSESSCLKSGSPLPFLLPSSWPKQLITFCFLLSTECFCSPKIQMLKSQTPIYCH